MKYADSFEPMWIVNRLKCIILSSFCIQNVCVWLIFGQNIVQKFFIIVWNIEQNGKNRIYSSLQWMGLYDQSWNLMPKKKDTIHFVHSLSCTLFVISRSNCHTAHVWCVLYLVPQNLVNWMAGTTMMAHKHKVSDAFKMDYVCYVYALAVENGAIAKSCWRDDQMDVHVGLCADTKSK